MVDGLAGEWRNLEGRSRGDVENGAGFPREHGSVEDTMCDEHHAVDVGVVHGDDVFNLEVREYGGSA